MFSIALLGVAVVIVAEGGLAILGLSVPPPTVTWGVMIAGGQSELQTGRGSCSRRRSSSS